MKELNIDELDFDKVKGLIPAIIQDAETKKVLMLGYMNRAALEKTLEINKVTFFSRTKERLWTKGETSKNYLIPKEIFQDCDDDTLLIKAKPKGPVCHTGADTCFFEENKKEPFLYQLEEVILDRKKNPREESYTCKLFNEGINKIAQKVGEEATELIIEAVDNNTKRLKEETADFIYHLLVLLREKDIELDELLQVLEARHSQT
ncbi:MAG: bifunctional phosphoribosyl-AMP cyclohydrolase/phosphoribosyl-ATP diphosphatase HisIE [Candidatus Marinimicrobia bacterium]|nr:bifunctional phosphoribosyl-AMP cyclohydrolase/phosphoribosyl-ATP diphosphatase HisIE [Candidatus Neomarinimicrobiota bacterium]